MKKLVYLLLPLCLLTLGCKHKFNREQWLAGEDTRLPMVKDLIKNHQLTGITYHQLIDSLGKADRVDSNYRVFYNVGKNKKGVSKELIFKLTKDSTVAKYKMNKEKE